MLVFKTRSERWDVQFHHEEDGESMDAVVCTQIPRIPGGHYEIARVEGIPFQCDEYGDPEIICEGEDANRLRDVCLIAHAPDMLETICRSLEVLDKLVDQDDTWAAESDEMHEVWCRLAEIQRELGDIADRAANIERL